ncbi:MAG: hypothetical protein ACR2N7_02450 [Acidimicrobiia bacterium]
MRCSLLVSIVAFGLIAAGCSSDSSSGTSDSAATTAAAESTTTTTEAPAITTTTTTTVSSFVAATDLVYMTIDDTELLMDVHVPAGEGPWPIVVAFHGLDSDGKNGVDTVTMAEAAAAEGMVVFAPSWIVWRPPTPPVPVPLDTFREWMNTGNCAVAFAQQNAAEYGGDPARTSVYGFSAGAGIALGATVNPSEDPIPGCETDALPEPLRGAVLGDGEYWLHSENFDPAFDTDTEAMQAELASLIDPAHWPEDLETTFFLWAAEDGTSPRAIDDPSDGLGWFAQRDPDGTIQSDLTRVDEFNDGVVTFVDASRLLQIRLHNVRLASSLAVLPGGHTPLDKMTEIIEYLKAATAQ